MKVVVCLQVRMNSTRLPKKALMPLAGKTSIAWIVDRLSQCKRIDGVVLATGGDPANDPLEEEARRLHIPCVRIMDETDLIARYLRTAESTHADAIVRVTGDCPFVDPELVDLLVSRWMENPDVIDAVTNSAPSSFPDGMQLDLLPLRTLKALDLRIPAGDVHREWVTPYLYHPDHGFRIVNIAAERDLSEYRFTLDYAADFDQLVKIADHFQGRKFGYRDLVAFMDERPDVRALVDSYVDRVKLPGSGLQSAAYQALVNPPKS